MSLQLDERRRAMLAEMNVKVWTDPRVQAPSMVTGAPVQARVAVESPIAGPVVRATPVPQFVAQSSAQRPAPAAATRSASASGTGTPVILMQRPAGIDTMDWPTLQEAVAGCQACKLCASRKNTVFGGGSRTADWLIVGEAPGESEDLVGEPFVGQAGKLLDNMLKAIGLSREADSGSGAYITNVLKCRPPANRNPLPEEVVECEPYLGRQVALLQPKIILALGRFAVQSLLQSSEPIGKLRGQVHEYHGVPVIVSYHPAYLLRSLPEKAKAWADLCLAMDVMRQRR